MRTETDVRIAFEVETILGPNQPYRDALYFPQGAVPDDATLQSIMQARADAWVALVQAPPPPDPPAQYAVTSEDGTVVQV